MSFFYFPILVFALRISSSFSDETCSNTDTDITSCSNQTCRLSSLDLLTIPPDLAHSVEVDIQLCSQHSELSTVREFRDLSAVHLAGEGGEVQCIGKASGITFIRVHSVWLENITLRGCGVESSNGGTVTRAGVFIIASAGVTLDGLTVSDPPGVGVAMRDVGHSHISDCTFTNKNDDASVKSGLHITVSEDDTSHTINGCVFTGGEGVGGYPAGHWWTDNPPMAFTGAGLGLSLLDHSTNNSMLVKGCLFAGNSALDGGAVHITVEDSSEGNSVDIEGSEFTGNRAGRGGGAIAGGFLSELDTPPTNNKINIANCNFTRNSAFMGGAVHLSSSEATPSCVAMGNEVVLDDCTWEGNVAHFGAAIDARSIKPQHSVVRYVDLLSITLRDSEFEENEVQSPSIGDSSHTLPLVVLKDCEFVRNRALYRFHDEHLRSRGEGAVRVNEFQLSIRGRLQLSDSTGSALYLDSTTVEFAGGSRSWFEANVGYRGGAVAITGRKSAIHMRGNSSILFRANRAESTGGAISQPRSDTCFITSDYKEGVATTATATKEAELVFEENTAGRYGKSLFVGSLQPCGRSTQDYEHILASVATFTFTRNGNHTVAIVDEVATLGRTIVSDGTHPQEMIPGKEASLGVHMVDDTNETVVGVFVVTVKSSDVDISIARAYTGNGRITLLGPPGATAEVRVVPIHRQSMEFQFEMTLSDCPPGYYYDNDTRACACSANSRDSSRRYVGIRTCQLQEFRATLLHSLWAGYDADTGPGGGSGKKFKTAYCPRGFCRRYNQTENDFLFPGTVTGYNLTAYVCRNNRKGILCAHCMEGHSVFYPTYYTCERDKQCELGWLYVILSQLLPATILFSVVIAFDVSLTGGAVNGFIFYMQMFDILVLTANDFLWFEEPIYEMLNGLRFAARVLNLRFFGLRRFSFCLWKGASSLDAIAINYVTVLYSFFMVVFTVKVLNPCILKIRRRCGRRKRAESTECKSSLSIIHGLSGFLVLCYSHSTTVSLYLIAHTALYGEGRKRHSNLVFYNGELAFFTGRHLAYAVPATVFLVLITALPPILLLSYPLCYKVLALCGMEESKFTKLLCRAFPLEKYKPFFDSFQGAFKDKHRYFAGVHFVYRMVWLLTFAYIRELASFYVVLEVELVVMLALNAYIQPYKKSWHNRLDTWIFLLLATINASTIYHYNQRNSYVDQRDSFLSIRSFQLSIAYLPLLYMCGYLVYQAVSLLRKKLASRKERKRRGSGDVEELELASLSNVYRRHTLTESSNGDYHEFEATGRCSVVEAAY